MVTRCSMLEAGFYLQFCRHLCAHRRLDGVIRNIGAGVIIRGVFNNRPQGFAAAFTLREPETFYCDVLDSGVSGATPNSLV